jgi:probable addiction module antidote protein
MAIKLTPFDPSKYLVDDVSIAAYLDELLQTGDPDTFLLGLVDVASVRGMSEVARRAGLGRESLYKALSPGAKPRFETIQRVLRALGVRQVIQRNAAGVVAVDDLSAVSEQLLSADKELKDAVNALIVKGGLEIRESDELSVRFARAREQQQRASEAYREFCERVGLRG